MRRLVSAASPAFRLSFVIYLLHTPENFLYRIEDPRVSKPNAFCKEKSWFFNTKSLGLGVLIL